MSKWNVSGTVTIPITMAVEADTEEEAIEAAAEQWPGLDDLVGNGASFGRIIGHMCEELTIEAGCDDPVFNGAEKA